MTFYENGSWKRELTNKDESAAKKTKVITLEMRFTLNSGIIMAGNGDL